VTRDSRQFELHYEFHSLRVCSREGTNPRFGLRRENTLMHMRRFLPVLAAVLLVFGLNQSLSAQEVSGFISVISTSMATPTMTRFQSAVPKEHFGNYRFAFAKPPSPLSASSFTSEMARMKNCSFGKQSGRAARRVRWTCAHRPGIKSVEFWYEKARWRERRPTVELYGPAIESGA